MLAQHSALSTQHGDAVAWLPLAEAAARTGLSIRAWQLRAADLAKRGLARLGPPAAGHGHPTWWIHPSADPALHNRQSSTINRQSPDLSPYPAHYVGRARQRLHWLQRWQSLCDTHTHTPKRDLAARVVEEARGKRQEAKDKGLLPLASCLLPLQTSVRSLEAWATAYERHGLVGLVDKYGSTSDRIGTGADTVGGPNRSPEAVNFFYDLYRTNQKRKVTRCHELTLSEAGRQGWSWPADYSATLKWLRGYDDIAITLVCRHGYDAWRSRFMPYNEQDYAAIHAGSMYVCDHHQFKCFARYRGQTIRPWLTAIEDAATRVLVGWHIGPVPHSDAILMSIRQAFETWGVPDKVKIDNGKDYDSKVLTGTTKHELRRLKRELGGDWKDILRRERAKADLGSEDWFGVLPEFGCEITRAIAYEPQSKLIERFFRTATDRFVRDLATFCDTSPERKPEALAKVLQDVSAIPTIEDLAKDFGKWVEEYHNTVHRGDAMNGRSPLTAWRQSSVKPAVAQEDALALMVNVRGLYKVGKNGVSLKVGSTPTGYGRDSAALTRLKGRQVLVAVDPADVSYALIYTPDRDKRRLICRAEANERISPCAADDLREAQAQINRARRDAKRARSSAATRMKTSARVARESAAKRRREILRATGTDDATANVAAGVSPAEGAPVRILQTGFEEAAKQVQTALERPATRDPARVRDLGDAATALGFGRGLTPKPARQSRPTSLFHATITSDSPEDEGDDNNEGTDAANNTTDLLRLVAGRAGDDRKR